MLKNSFLFCEGMQNTNFVISKLLSCKGVQCDVHFSWKVVKTHILTAIDYFKSRKMLKDRLGGLQASKLSSMTCCPISTTLLPSYCRCTPVVLL